MLAVERMGVVMYQSIKKYDHNSGFSCCFRQWRAKSHCNQTHGYALAFKFIFESKTLDDNNWVMDFGNLKPVKQFLEHWFDHTTLVAEDDPQMSWFEEGQSKGLLDLRVLPAVGCEMVARFVYTWAASWLVNEGRHPRIHLRSVEVSEHAGNSAVYEVLKK